MKGLFWILGVMIMVLLRVVVDRKLKVLLVYGLQ
jgi:hypothetical protein